MATSGSGAGSGAAGSGILPDNYPRSDDRVGHVQREVEEVSGIMKENVQAIVSQGQHLNELNSKTDDLLHEARNFKKSSTEMKNAMWWKEFRIKLAIGGIVFIVLLIIYFNLRNAFKGDDY
jgi:flagellar biosynthesis/type III secretory pathway M-ring protein FliF/YscJ